MKKYKVLMLSDHALSTSGVGTQSRHLIEGMIKKGRWSFRQFGAAMKHTDYRTIAVNDDFVIKPIDGFGNPEMLRVALATEKPDAVFLFTDPRFFIWLFEMEDEIHQICPIVWWHVWDNRPTPEFNFPLYQATDLINCHSHLTYEMCSENFPEKTNFIPHSLPPHTYFQMDDDRIMTEKVKMLGWQKRDNFVLFWVNRNARRKRPGDVLLSWKMFTDKVKERKGNVDASLIMHTDPFDQEGPNLLVMAEKLGISDSVLFSNQRVDFEQINLMHNIADCCINLAYAEGFGLGTLESMQAGTPIIASKTGGLTRQVVDHRDGSENGVALDIKQQTLVGSQGVPYIYEDYCNVEDAAEAIFKIYEMNPNERKALGLKAKKYVEDEFNYQDTVDRWDETLWETIENFKNNKKDNFRLKTF